MTHVFEGEFVHQNLGRIRKEFRVDQMCEWETRKATVRGLFFCEHGIVIDTCEELDHLDEQVMQYLNITLREKDTQVIPFCADGTYWVPVEAGEAKDVRLKSGWNIISVIRNDSGSFKDISMNGQEKFRRG